MSLTRRQILTVGGAAAIGGPALAVAGRPPHIVFILADDLGWGDLGCYGQTDYDTPALDALAASGQRLRQAYANSPVCSATRTALITGRYQYRLRVGLEEPLVETESPHGLPPTQATLPGLLRAAGYRTALVGKWHLGFAPRFGPLKSGYDEFYGNYGGIIDYFTHKDDVGADGALDFWDGEQLVRTQGYYTDLLTERALALLRRQAQPGADARPLFLSLHYTAPHWPWEGPQDEAVSRELKSLMHHEGGSLAVYGRMVQAMDTGIGRLLTELKRSGLIDTTLIVFTSDNGGERFSRTWPLSGQKTELLEGGIRVPTLVSWPGWVAPGGVSEQVAISMDWLPTLLAAAGAPPAAQTDGIDLLPQLRGAAPVVSRKLFWRYKAHGQRALRDGTMKYLRIKDNEFLFDLAADERERANLAARQPARLAVMRAEWAAWDATMLPIPTDAFSGGLRGKVQADRYGASSSD